jgi:hypothetical protein
LIFPYAVCAQSVIIIISIIFIERFIDRPTNISLFLLSDGNIASPYSVKQPEIYAKILPHSGYFCIIQWLRDVATIGQNCYYLFLFSTPWGLSGRYAAIYRRYASIRRLLKSITKVDCCPPAFGLGGV